MCLISKISKSQQVFYVIIIRDHILSTRSICSSPDSNSKPLPYGDESYFYFIKI